MTCELGNREDRGHPANLRFSAPSASPGKRARTSGNAGSERERSDPGGRRVTARREGVAGSNNVKRSENKQGRWLRRIAGTRSLPLLNPFSALSLVIARYRSLSLVIARYRSLPSGQPVASIWPPRWLQYEECREPEPVLGVRARYRSFSLATKSANNASRCAAESGTNGGRIFSQPGSFRDAAKIAFNAGITGYFRSVRP
jgi:hypothetical protein